MKLPTGFQLIGQVVGTNVALFRLIYILSGIYIISSLNFSF